VTIRWESAGATHIGRVRSENEDSFRIDDRNGIFIVADGMGGHAAGEVASALAAETMLGRLSELIEGSSIAPGGGGLTAEISAGERIERAILEGFVAGRRAMVLYSEDDPRTRGMGTTLTVAVFDPAGRVHIGHLGDSRLYRLRAELLTQMTTDHTWVQEEVDAGRLSPEAARTHSLSHILTRVLSADEPSEPDILRAEVLPGDVYLLCSDGLYNHFDPGALATMLGNPGPVTDIVSHLIRAANRRGGTDNITGIVVRID
jgi:serine/threonine protein phosphatase PrpC